jgi:hypothetical protein
MFRSFFIITLLLSFSFASDIAIVKKLSGNAFAKRGDTLAKLVIGSKIQTGDILITKAKSSLGFIFHDGTILSLGENSILAIKEYLFQPLKNKYDFDVNMKKGLASFESGKIGKLSPQSVKFRVPEGVVGIRGTKFYVEVK